MLKRISEQKDIKYTLAPKDIMLMINHYQRYQAGLTLNDVFPNIAGYCACGCGRILTGKRRKWATDNCRENAFLHFSIIKGDNEIIRKEVFNRDNGFCYHCGQFDNKWQVDHIVPVSKGGGGCGLDNLQTLCNECHVIKHYRVSHHRAISSQAASSLCRRRLYEIGDGVSLSLKTS